ncbi:MAG TPA: putative toxin-antitoxin system toxin component, PIN family [Burkholderiaceae bacterium]|nr:putative toxin-antitoxin system toxin component, PIN family [Burkholderiaceae bacterium]
MGVPRIVLDTHVVLDLWVFRDPGARALLEALVAESVIALRSEACDAELDDVLRRPRFAARADPATILAQWRALAQPVARVVPAPWTCTDPDDQKFLDLAFSGGAAFLLTKDRALLRVARRARPAALRIVEPGRAGICA